MTFLEYLLDKNIITKDNAITVKREHKENPKASLEEIFAEKLKIPPAETLKYRGAYMQVPIKSLEGQKVPFDILQYIPEESAIHYQFVPIAIKDGFLEVGLVNPRDIEARDALNFISSKIDMPFKVFLISEQDFHQVLEVYKGLSGQVTQALTDLETEINVDDEIGLSLKDKKGGQEKKARAQIIEDAPVTKIVATILRYAVEGNASDVHIEPMRENVRVRFRVDGTLNTSLVLPVKVHQAVIARIKVLTKIKLDEKRKPQDGRFSATIEGRRIDFRVSTFPAYYGEKVVMRILDQEKGVKPLEELGFGKTYLDMVRKAIGRPYGIILISGPTGSGKTTTLYSILKEIDKEHHNVLSLEDPVEYSIEGVAQSQVRPEIGYTFANGLRTTLRQDPDIIMVGEIRDGETAKLAIQAALTGHLVLSTIHTNTAAGIVPRLIDMGVDPYLIPPTLVLGIGQRLTRLLCPGTGKPRSIEGSIQKMIDAQFVDLPEQYRDRIPHGTEVMNLSPTPDCPNGTRGREAVFEMFEMNREIEDVILNNPIESAIYDLARKQGMITMKEHALVKALEKKIPFEEVSKL